MSDDFFKQVDAYVARWERTVEDTRAELKAMGWKLLRHTPGGRWQASKRERGPSRTIRIVEITPEALLAEAKARSPNPPKKKGEAA